MAIKIARESQNDYLPELEAVAQDEFGLLFERPPQTQALKVGEVVRGTFRFLGTVRSAELFYIFARLDPYEQAELIEQAAKDRSLSQNPAETVKPASENSRPQ
jgi:hypothetical protein